jgi:gas vesicle protein
MNFQVLRNSFVVGSLGVSFTGFIALFTPYQQFSQFLMSAGLGSLASSSLAIQQSEKLSNRKSKKFLNEIESLKSDTEHFAQLLTDKHNELTTVKEKCSQYENTGNLLYESLEEVKTQLSATKKQLADNQDINFSAAVETLRDSLKDVQTQVNNLLPYLIKKFGIDVKPLVEEFNQDVKSINTQIGVISDNSKLTNEELISACIAIQHQILTKGIGLKAKLYKSAVDKLQKQLVNVISIDEHNERLTAVKDYYTKNLKAIQNEFSQVADGVISAYKSDFAETVQEGMNQINELEKLQHEIISLNGKLSELSKPLRFPGLSEQARIGNAIIDFYSRLGYVLDAIDWQSTESGYKLLFHTSRNGSRFISTDLLNDGDNPAKLKEVSAALNNTKFEQSDRASYFYVNIETRKPEKKVLSVDDIRRMIEPAHKFGEVVTRYHSSKPTLRVMTRTGGGKGIAVKNLLHHYVNNWEGWEIWLSDPQHGSFEDYWNCPKIAKSPAEARDVLETFIQEFSDRKNDQSKNADIPVMGVFDETDKTFDRKQKAGIAQVWTEIRHRKMKLILIGQSGEVGKNGWTWDEMNNCSLMFIGDALGTAIKHADDLGWSSDMKNKIPAIYAKVSEFFNSFNSDIPIKNQYRFALLVDGMRYDFVEIPPALEGSIENNKSWLVSSPWQLRALSQGESIACVHCGSVDVKRNGKQGDRQRYKCNDCNKSFQK